MSIKISTKEIEIIKDCRDLTRGEMLSFITVDCYSFKLNEELIQPLLSALVKGPWEIKCDPFFKSITYSATVPVIKIKEGELKTQFNSYSAEFIPDMDKGIVIIYRTPETKCSVNWSVEEVINLIGAY